MSSRGASTGSHRRRERGQSLVEFALIVPLFLAILLAVVDFGMAIRTQVTVANAAREGARIGVICPYPDDEAARTTYIIDEVEKKMGDLVDSSTVVDPASVPCAPGEDVVVTVQQDYNYVTPLGNVVSFLTGGALPDPIHLESTTTMRSE